MQCADCKFLCVDGPRYDQPYQEIYCNKGHFDGCDIDEIYHDHLEVHGEECADFEDNKKCVT